jgi:hypothetical protein
VKTQIFIRCWEADLDWQDVLLRSIARYWKHREAPVVIVATPECEGKICQTHVPVRIVYETKREPQKRGAVFIAFNADKYVDPDTDVIVFMDNDCVFSQHSSINDLMDAEGRFLIRTLHYDRYREWHQNATESDFSLFRENIRNDFHFDDDQHHMWWFPYAYWTKHIRECREVIEANNGTDLYSVMCKYQEGKYSEFCHFGSYVKMYHPDQYVFCEEGEWPPCISIQFHSWTEKPSNPTIYRVLWGLNIYDSSVRWKN